MALWSLHKPSAAIVAVGLSLLQSGASAQEILPPQQAQVTSPAGCRALAPLIRDKGSGGQWLVGDGIALDGQPNAPTPMTVLDKALEKVTCYSQAEVAGKERVFVVADDLSVCGWVDRDRLLPVNRLPGTSLDASPARVICETPRAMPFRSYCGKYGQLSSDPVSEEECKGVPPQLRAKGVLVGSTVESTARPRHRLLSAPVGGAVLPEMTFFSVLEVHDVQRGAGGATMLLVGDGAGELFGWIDRRAVRLWPTRLGLYYDEAARGGMFLFESGMKEHNRKGAPLPEIGFDGNREALETFLHGRLPLVAYPIVRSVDPATDPLQPPGQPAWHEVIFIGKTGEASTSQLALQAELSNRIQQLRRVNVIFAVDTTESMTDYLPFIRDGIADFIRGYNSRAVDESQRMPDMRLSVVAYSDFLDKDRLDFSGPIGTEVLMPPTSIGPNFDVSAALRGITAHKGLRDSVGEFDEAALETVARLASAFESGAWFEEGPRIIIHVGDHGSRGNVPVQRVAAELADRNVYYYPIVVVTDDKGDTRRSDSRGRLERQGLQLLAPLIEVDGAERASLRDLPRVDLADRSHATAGEVTLALELAVVKVTQTINRVRGRYARGPEQGRTERDLALSDEALNRAASRIRLDVALERQYGLDEAALKAMAQADNAFAPSQLRRDGLAQPVDWTYFVAFENDQVRFLQPVLDQLCTLSGRPDQRGAFRKLVVRMAEIFSGDRIASDAEMRGVLTDLAVLPGVRGSFLSIPGDQMLQRIDSDDPAVQQQLRRDVCWVSYHLNNVVAGSYVRPSELAWNPQTLRYQLRPDVSVRARNYRYVPLVGSEIVYLPNWMFVVPSQVGDLNPGTQGCSGWSCN